MVLLYVYVASMIVGGILLLASLLLGDGSEGEAHAEVDVQADADAHIDIDVDAQADLDAAGEVEAGTDAQADFDAGQAGITFSDFWLPFTSLRFWVFFLAFFGLTGTVLSVTQLSGPALTLVSASGLGFVSGFAAAFIVRRLRQSVVGTVVRSTSYRGAEGLVLLPVGAQSRGKIRLSVDGSDIDLLARGAEETEIPIGARVLVIAVEGTEAVVVPAPLETQTES